MLAKIIKFCKDNERDLILVFVVILTSVAGFGLGRLSRIRELKTPIMIEENSKPGFEVNTAAVSNIVSSGQFVASKNGSKYHFPWCSGAQSIKEENKIWFNSREEAEKAGYEPASNCKGLK